MIQTISDVQNIYTVGLFFGYELYSGCNLSMTIIIFRSVVHTWHVRYKQYLDKIAIFLYSSTY